MIVARLGWFLGVWLLCGASHAWAAGGATLDAPAEVNAGSAVAVKWTATSGEYDKIVVVPAGADAKAKRLAYAYARTSPTLVTMPDEPGSYELRYVSGKTDAVLASRPLKVRAVTATVQGPKTAVGGATIAVKWTGPKNEYDKIVAVAAGAPNKARWLEHAYARTSPTEIKVPEQPGKYELRYITGQTDSTLGKTEIEVTGASASVRGPSTAVSGATISVSWTGPNNEYDKIVIVSAGAADKQAPLESEYVRKSPTLIKVPEPTGTYEIRYVTGASGSTLAKASVAVTAASASIEGPITAVAGTTFKIQWTGPANEYDRISAFAKNATDGRWAVNGYVKKGQQLSIQAPTTAGEYELRYLTGDTHSTLARAQLVVTPGKQEPGKIAVSVATQASGTTAQGGAIEVVLDVSGSMLQRIGTQRRIDIATQTLKDLTSKVIPAATPFALRVFGREAASCQTTLEIPLQPLDPVAVGKQVAALEPKAGARTPIAASLDSVVHDLRAAKGERLVVLITDGEETCGGDPAAVIAKLRKTGVGVRVNIVGFAVDEAKLVSTFKLWAEAGGGAYFEARDAAGLNQALALAMRPAFEVIDARKRVIAHGFAGDPAVEVMPGKYTVKLKSGAGGSQSVTVKPNETAAARF